jgi:acyl carrier protein phosphodiesterase
VNFFGHAAVATWLAPPSGAAAGVVLGAMLPDFATMCGGRIASADEDDVRRGIDLHHATDAVFHQLPVVTGLMRELDGNLERDRCARGPRRAVAHIGVELLLDGVLVGEPAYRAAYLHGLSHQPALQWRDPDAAPRFAVLLDRLRARGIPDDLGSPDAITTRVQHILAHRPLLAPSPDDLRAIRAALVAFKVRIDAAAEAVMRGMRAAFADREAAAITSE